VKNLALSVLASTLLFLNSCGTAAQASEAETDGLVVANVVCPMVPAHEADAEVTVRWNDKTIAMCCKGCIGKWEALSDDEKATKLAGAMKQN
jgi:hypothetical protein